MNVHHKNTDSLDRVSLGRANDLPILNTNKDKSRKKVTWSHKHAPHQEIFLRSKIGIANLKREATQIAFFTQGYIRDKFKISCITQHHLYYIVSHA